MSTPFDGQLPLASPPCLAVGCRVCPDAHLAHAQSPTLNFPLLFLTSSMLSCPAGNFRWTGPPGLSAWHRLHLVRRAKFF